MWGEKKQNKKTLQFQIQFLMADFLLDIDHGSNIWEC